MKHQQKYTKNGNESLGIAEDDTVEISFDCNCPDWADMCKHVAAALYAIGIRLDEDPKLLFVLRNLEIDDLIKKAVRDKSKKLLKKADSKSSRVIDGNEAADIFGVNMIDEIDFNPKTKTRKLRKKGSGYTTGGLRKKCR